MVIKRYSHLCLILLSLLFVMNSCSKEKELKPIRFIGDYNRDFNDLHKLHLSAANTIGIKSIKDREEAENLKKQLRELKSCKLYEVDNLTYSVPFVVPQAEALVDKIATNFADSLKNLNAPHYKLLITSVTRTQEDVKRLSKRNLNASDTSAHLHGTTIDISWKRFIKNSKSKTELTEDQLKKVLASVLRDLKKEGLCYVKHEKKQACFHITAR
ncbi:uncharacterized protein YcbK (DUF882 family) [Dysgonomonadaceae bacterium PH5-43]|nr:uncharacterized protein YcbK (DUF882 family) [Dysgonomonadaceae bacterium PH5-43]